MQTLRDSLRPWGQALANLLFPLECASCHFPLAASSGSDRLCRSCTEKLTPIAPPYCQRCAEPFPADPSLTIVCPNCQNRPMAFDFAFAGYESRGPVRDLIHHFKYNRQLQLRVVLGQLLLQTLQEPRIQARQDWILTPVPLHARKLRDRQFNQAHEISRRLHRHTHFPLVPGLRRQRDTTSQATLDRKDRLANLKDAFTLTPKARRQRLFEGRHILLIDDVRTTGATLHECAQVLKKEGQAATVVGLCIARG